MTGRTSHRSLRRLRTVGRTFFALGAALLLVAALAPFAVAVEVTGPESDDRAELFDGNFTNADCETTNSLYVSPTASASDAYVSAVISRADVSTTVDDEPVTYLNAHVLNVTAQPGVVIVEVSVKATSSYNLYPGNFPNMIAPIAGGSGNPADISHYTICYDIVPDLTLVKSGPGTALHDGTFSYTLTVGNTGAGDTGAITVTDTLPSEVDFVSANDGCSYDSETHTVTCDLDPLALGDTHEVTIEVAVTTTECGPFTNSADAIEASTEDTASDDATTTIPTSECETIVVEPDPTPSVDVEKLVSLNGGDFEDADTAPGVELDVALNDPAVEVEFLVIITNNSGDGTVLTLNSLTDEVTVGDNEDLDLSDCTFPAEGLPDGESVQCQLGPFEAFEGAHTNTVTVSASGGGQTVGDSDPANYAVDRVGGVVFERPPPPAPGPDPDPVGEPAPEVEAEELPRTGAADLWLAGLALMLIGGGLLTIARGRAMAAVATPTTTWTTRRMP